MEAINSTCTDLEMLTFERGFLLLGTRKPCLFSMEKAKTASVLVCFFNGSVKLDHVYINNMLQVVLHYLQ